MRFPFTRDASERGNRTLNEGPIESPNVLSRHFGHCEVAPSGRGVSISNIESGERHLVVLELLDLPIMPLARRSLSAQADAGGTSLLERPQPPPESPANRRRCCARNRPCTRTILGLGRPIDRSFQNRRRANVAPSRHRVRIAPKADT